jgi:hypothetical protein
MQVCAAKMQAKQDLPVIDIINAATNFEPWPRAITLIAFFALLAWVAWLVYKLLHPLVWREVEDDEQRSITTPR